MSAMAFHVALLREVEREVYPSLKELERERHRTVPRPVKREPAERVLPDVQLDRLPTKGA